MMKCILCSGEWLDQAASENTRCPAPNSGGRHVLQEKIDGARNPDTGERADFLSVDAADLKAWGDQAKKIYNQ